jgi:hypothetical protein
MISKDCSVHVIQHDKPHSYSKGPMYSKASHTSDVGSELVYHMRIYSFLMLSKTQISSLRSCLQAILKWISILSSVRAKSNQSSLCSKFLNSIMACWVLGCELNTAIQTESTKPHEASFLKREYLCTILWASMVSLVCMVSLAHCISYTYDYPLFSNANPRLETHRISLKLSLMRSKYTKNTLQILVLENWHLVRQSSHKRW